MAKIKPGRYFPLSVLAKLENARIENGVIITDSPCKEVWEVMYKEVGIEFRDFIVAFTLVSTAIILSIAGVFWGTYTLVNNHMIPIGLFTLFFSYATSTLIAYVKRKNFLKDLIKECEDE